MQSYAYIRRLLGALTALLLAWALPAAAQQPVATAVLAPAEYRLGPGDVVRVSVYQNQDLTLEARVNESGNIAYPLLGSVKLAGLGIAEAEKTIADGLRNGNFVRQPQVTLSVLQIRANLVSVLGQVNKPGRYPIDLADTRLTDLLAAAGGVAGGGSDIVVITGTRKGQPYRLEVNVQTLFTAGTQDNNIVVQNGDTLWVDRQPLVYIYGEVQRPGPMRLERDMTVMQALATGGGLNARGTQKGIRVHRKVDGAIKVIESGLDDKVQEGDVVFVRESLF